jgi:protein involved in sex pheromone biosynthesis
MKKIIIEMIALTLLLQACATIVNGKFQDVNIKTTPPGTIARIGTQSCITPCTLNIYRKNADYLFR